MLVDGALARGPTVVGEIPPDGALEERLAALAGELAVVLAGTLVAANDALDVALLLLLLLLGLLLLLMLLIAFMTICLLYQLLTTFIAANYLAAAHLRQAVGAC